MTEVFMVIADYPYDGLDILSVWASEKEAKEEIDRLYRFQRENGGPFYDPSTLSWDRRTVGKPYTTKYANDPAERSING